MRLSCWQPNSCGKAALNGGLRTTALFRPHKPLPIAVHGCSTPQAPAVGGNSLCLAFAAEAGHAGLARASTAAGLHHKQAAALDRPASQMQQSSVHTSTAQAKQGVALPVLQPCIHVQLLQQAAVVNSWPAAEQLLCQHSSQLQQAHVGLLWWQLCPKLARCKQQARVGFQQKRGRQDTTSTLQPFREAENLAAAEGQLQRQRVLQMLLEVTVQHVDTLSPQSLAYTVQGIAAAAAAGTVALHPGIVPQQPQQQLTEADADAGPAGVLSPTTGLQLPAALPRLLWHRLMSVAAICSLQQLSYCVAGGQHLGWQLDRTSCSSSSSCSISNSSSTPRSSSSIPAADTFELCCWPVLERAMSGVLGSCLQQVQIDSREVGQLLHALAGYVQQQRLQQWHGTVELQQALHGGGQQHVWRPAFQQFVQQLADTACALKAEPRVVQTTYIITQHNRVSSSTSSNNDVGAKGAGVAAPAAISTDVEGVQSSSASSGNSFHVLAADSVSAVTCSLQASALLAVLPNPQQLEVLLQQLEPHLQAMPAAQLLQLVQALLDLNVEPWQSWLQICYSRLGAGLHSLPPQQLLQLLQLLPCVTRLQPDRPMLSGLAKVTAVHVTRYSWRQLAMLPLGFAAVGYRPEPYWLKDYMAAGSVHLRQQLATTQQQQQQQQQPRQLLLQLRLLTSMLFGVAWLAAAATIKPPPSWLSMVEQLLIVALEAIPGASSSSSSSIRHASVAPGADATLLCKQQGAMSVDKQAAPAGAPVQTHAPQQACGCASKGSRQGPQQQLRDTMPAETAALVLAAFTQMQYQPSMQLRQLLGCGYNNSASNRGSNDSSTCTQGNVRRCRRRDSSSTCDDASKLACLHAAPVNGTADSRLSALHCHSTGHVAHAAEQAQQQVVQQRQQQAQQQQQQQHEHQVPPLLAQPQHLPSVNMTVQLYNELEGLSLMQRDVQHVEQASCHAVLLGSRSSNDGSIRRACLDACNNSRNVRLDDAVLAAS